MQDLECLFYNLFLDAPLAKIAKSCYREELVARHVKVNNQVLSQQV